MRIEAVSLEDGRWVKLLGWGNVAEAKTVILDSIARAKSAAT